MFDTQNISNRRFKNISPRKQTITHQLVSGRIFVRSIRSSPRRHQNALFLYYRKSQPFGDVSVLLQNFKIRSTRNIVVDRRRKINDTRVNGFLYDKRYFQLVSPPPRCRRS